MAQPTKLTIPTSRVARLKACLRIFGLAIIELETGVTGMAKIVGLWIRTAIRCQFPASKRARVGEAIFICLNWLLSPSRFLLPCRSAMESGGLLMTRSLVSRPLNISTVLPKSRPKVTGTQLHFAVRIPPRPLAFPGRGKSAHCRSASARWRWRLR